MLDTVRQTCQVVACRYGAATGYVSPIRIPRGCRLVAVLVTRYAGVIRIIPRQRHGPVTHSRAEVAGRCRRVNGRHSLGGGTRHAGRCACNAPSFRPHLERISGSVGQTRHGMTRRAAVAPTNIGPIRIPGTVRLVTVLVTRDFGIIRIIPRQRHGSVTHNRAEVAGGWWGCNGRGGGGRHAGRRAGTKRVFRPHLERI